jgi:hypothetical protein
MRPLRQSLLPFYLRYLSSSQCVNLPPTQLLSSMWPCSPFQSMVELERRVLCLTVRCYGIHRPRNYNVTVLIFLLGAIDYDPLTATRPTVIFAQVQVRHGFISVSLGDHEQTVLSICTNFKSLSSLQDVEIPRSPPHDRPFNRRKEGGKEVYLRDLHCMISTHALRPLTVWKASHDFKMITFVDNI